jgi:hypothetical protein
MPVYQLVIRSSDGGPTETLQFIAANPASAFTLANRRNLLFRPSFGRMGSDYISSNTRSDLAVGRPLMSPTSDRRCDIRLSEMLSSEDLPSIGCAK